MLIKYKDDDGGYSWGDDGGLAEEHVTWTEKTDADGVRWIVGKHTDRLGVLRGARSRADAVGSPTVHILMTIRCGVARSNPATPEQLERHIAATRLRMRREAEGLAADAGFPKTYTFERITEPFLIKTHWPKVMRVTVVDADGERTVEVDASGDVNQNR